jgi:AmmeMemoRadiSam system protein A
MPEPTESARGALLLDLARRAIAAALQIPAARSAPISAGDAGWLDALGASFVTVRVAGELRGCIGSVRARRSLRADVEKNAVSAAQRDPRFAPLRADEYAQLTIEVSLLSPLVPLGPLASDVQAAAALVPGRDGVMLEAGEASATFLPQVWGQLPEPAAFLAALRQKAGLAPGSWPHNLRLFRYRVEKWSDKPV